MVNYEFASGRFILYACFNHLWTFFWNNPFLPRLYEIYLSITDLEKFAEFSLLQNLHLCTHKSVYATNCGPFGEIGADFSVQLSSEHKLLKLKTKKLSPKTNVKNIEFSEWLKQGY